MPACPLAQGTQYTLQTPLCQHRQYVPAGTHYLWSQEGQCNCTTQTATGQQWRWPSLHTHYNQLSSCTLTSLCRFSCAARRMSLSCPPQAWTSSSTAPDTTWELLGLQEGGG